MKESFFVFFLLVVAVVTQEKHQWSRYVDYRKEVTSLFMFLLSSNFFHWGKKINITVEYTKDIKQLNVKE